MTDAQPLGRPPKITKAWADKEATQLPQRFWEGESVAEVCAELGICKHSFYKACDISPSFLHSYKKGLDLSEAWWCRLGREGAAGRADIQPTTWIFNMKNRHNWVDKKEVDVSGGFNVNFTKDDAALL